MSTRAFARWLAIFRAAFPSDERLRTVGVFWYPGDGKDRQAERLRAAGAIGTVQGYRLWLSNRGPDDERIRVGVRRARGPEESHFWCGSEIELDRCYFQVESSEIEVMRQLLATKSVDIERAWQRFSSEAREAQQRWLSKLAGTHSGWLGRMDLQTAKRVIQGVLGRILGRAS